MRNLLLILLTFYLIILSAQDTPGSSLDLGDVIIEGESDLIKDSLGTNYDLDSLLNVSEKEKFLYKPEPVLESVSEQAAFMSNKIISLEVKGGNYSFGSLRGALSLHPLLNFNLDLYNRSLKSDWNTTELGVNWLAYYKEFQFNTGGEYLKYDSEIIDTKAKDLILGIKRISNSEKKQLNFPDFSVSANYYQIDQADTDLSSIDVRSNINWNISTFTIDTNLDYLKEKFQGDFTFFLNNLPINRLGLYVHYRPEFYGETEKFMFSVDLFNRINLFKSLFLNISNTPSLSKNSYLDDLKHVHYQATFDNTNQTSLIINPEISVEYFGPLYLKGFYKFSMHEDYYLFLPDTTGLYRLANYNNVDQQDLGLSISYSFMDLEIGNDFILSNYEVKDRTQNDIFSEYKLNIPYVPEINNTTHINFKYADWKLRIENNFLTGREDELGEKMSDINLLNAYLSYQIFNNFEILGEVENVLDEEYIRSSYLQEEGMQFKAGFRWSY